MSARDFDVIIIGSGPGGSTVADILTAAGRSVLILEKGRNHLIDLDDPSKLAEDFSNDEIKFMFRHFLGPDPLLEPRTFRRHAEEGDRIHVGEVNSVPTTVGGGGTHADGKTPRFREEDFRMLSTLGPMDGAAVADWPLTYDDLEPSYAEAERLVGVAGDADANPFAAWRSGPYPMPPGAPMYGAVLSAAAAEQHGLHPYAAPTAANSVPYDGRPACNNCGFCAFFGCPIHAKGDPVASLRRALLSGRCELRPETFVSKILVSNGRATGVTYLDASGQESTVAADQIILAAGGLETPRLLLLSGLEHPMIGRHLMFHFQTIIIGQMPMRIHGHRGRSVTHVHDDHMIQDAASLAAARDAGLPWFRGGMVEHAGPAHPIMEAKVAPWGPLHKQVMRESTMREHLWGFIMQGEDMPQATNRVDLDPAVRDVRGFPVARITYQPHRHELAASKYYGAKLLDVLKTLGTAWSIAHSSPNPDGTDLGGFDSPIPTSRHIAGTTRMGTDPRTSVCDPWARLHDVPNVMIADSSIFPMGSGYGPTLTLIAMAIRNAHALIG
ncbi:MAG: GMC family oxidoreductase [Acidimicrobiales bacterium]